MKIKTHVILTRDFEKQLEKIPDFIQKKVIFWVFMVETNGLREVMKSPGFHDEPLKGNRKGQRSIRLNRSYRLIYRVTDNLTHIELLEVNKHEY